MPLTPGLLTPPHLRPRRDLAPIPDAALSLPPTGALLPFHLPQHPDEHRSGPVFLAVEKYVQKTVRTSKRGAGAV
jgi:hypothetical protein